MVVLKQAAVGLLLVAVALTNTTSSSLPDQNTTLRADTKIRPSNFTDEEQAKGLSCGTNIYGDGHHHDEHSGGESEGGEHGGDGEQSADGEEHGGAEGEESGELKKSPAEVVGGKDARPGEHPWLAKVLLDGNGHCGGSILNAHYILTAAHCLYSCSQAQAFTADQITVVVGSYAKRGDQGRVHKAERLIVHEHYCTTYNEGNSPDDIGLIRLAQPIQFGLKNKGHGSVNTICLPRAGTQYRDGDWFTVAGWGMTRYQPKEYADNLQQVQVPHVESGRCDQMLQRLLSLPQPIQINFDANHEICAGGRENESSCKGDSGGPLTRGVGGGARELVGVVSRGQLCAHRDSPNIYARVDTYLDWIGENMRD